MREGGEQEGLREGMWWRMAHKAMGKTEPGRTHRKNN